jgi:hypothetical protein
MQVSSYTFKSPYPQAVQVGQPDPVSAKQESQTQQDPALSADKKSTLAQGKVSPTLDSGITVSLSTLQSGNSQSGVSEFKSLVNVNQAQQAYSQG